MTKDQNNSQRDGIGTLNEHNLHAELIQAVSQPGDQLEALVDGYYIDVLRDNLAIEVQTSNLAKLSRKVNKLDSNYQVEIIYPLQAIKYIIKQTPEGEVLSRRKSPKREKPTDIFNQLVHAPHVIDAPNISLSLYMIEAEEIWCDDGQGSWRRKNWSIAQRHLIRIISTKKFQTTQDFLTLLPRSLPSPFTNKQLASQLGIQSRLAGKITYSLRKMNLLETVGKEGKAYLFDTL